MSSAVQSSEESPGRKEEPDNPLIQIALKIRGSFLYATMALGVFLIVAALVIDVLSLKEGVIQAMFLVWGISALLYAAGGFVFLRLIGYR